MEVIIGIIGECPPGYEFIAYLVKAQILIICIKGSYDIINNLIRDFKGI